VARRPSAVRKPVAARPKPRSHEVFHVPCDPAAGQAKRQSTYIDAVQTLADTSIYFGKYQTNPHTCRNCGYVHNANSEKMTDVNIAVELLQDAFRTPSTRPSSSRPTATWLRPSRPLRGCSRASASSLPARRAVSRRVSARRRTHT